MRISHVTGALFIAAGIFVASSQASVAAVPSKSELAATFVGKSVDVGKSGQRLAGTAWLGQDGAYTYSRPDGHFGRGRYVLSNGRICVTFESGRLGCYRITKHGASYVLLDARGERYPVSVK